MSELKTLKDLELTAEELARIFHDTYEEFSITNKWKTQEKCQVEFDNLPGKNRETMIDTCQHILLILEAREKAEAIKWVKTWMHSIDRSTSIYPLGISDNERIKLLIECEFAIKWVKHFHNITEDDLNKLAGKDLVEDGK